MGKHEQPAKTADAAVAETATEPLTTQTLDLDAQIQALALTAPPFWKNGNLLKLYLLIIPACLVAAITLGFDASMMSGLQAVPAWDECKSLSPSLLSNSIAFFVLSFHVANLTLLQTLGSLAVRSSASCRLSFPLDVSSPAPLSAW